MKLRVALLLLFSTGWGLAQNTGDWSTDYTLDDTPADTDVFIFQLSPFTSGSQRHTTWADLKGSLTAGDLSDASANAISLITAADYAAMKVLLDLEIGTDIQAWDAVLDATTASFLTADETKLDGIEALADVTDATNVASAGALMLTGGAMSGEITGTPIDLHSTSDIILELGDAAGANVVSVRDSASVEVFSIDSDGDMTAGSMTITGNLDAGGLLFSEKADATAPVAGNAELWVDNLATQELIFTDDTDTDRVVSLRDDLFTEQHAASHTLTNTECFGGVYYATAAATLTLPPVEVGMSVTICTVGAVAVSVDPDAADLLVLDGTALDDGDKATNLSTAGDLIVLTYYDATGWYAASNGWTDGGP